MTYLNIAKTEFECPYCCHQHTDIDDKYLNRINKSKSGIAIVICKGCFSKFGMTYNYMGDAVSFKF